MVRVARVRGQTCGAGGTVIDTLLFLGPGLTNVREKAGVGGAEAGKVLASLVETQLSIDRKPRRKSIGISLAIVLPPANRAQSHGIGRGERFAAAAGAAIPGFRNRAHMIGTAKPSGRFTYAYIRPC